MQLAQDGERRDVDARDGLQVEHNAAQRRLGGGDQRPQAIRNVAGIGEQQRRIKAIDENRRCRCTAFVVGEVVEAAVGRQPAQDRVARPRHVDQDVRKRQADAERARPAARRAAARPAVTASARPNARRSSRSSVAPLADLDQVHGRPRRGSPTARPAATRRARARGTARTGSQQRRRDHCASCVVTPLASAVTERDVLAPIGNPLDQAGGDVAGAERRQFAVGIDRLAMLCRQRARHQDAFREHEERRARARPGASACRSRSAMLGSEGAGIGAGERLQDARRRARRDRARARRRWRSRTPRARPAHAARSAPSTSITAIRIAPSASVNGLACGSASTRIVDAQEERVARQRRRRAGPAAAFRSGSSAAPAAYPTSTGVDRRSAMLPKPIRPATTRNDAGHERERGGQGGRARGISGRERRDARSLQAARWSCRDRRSRAGSR